MPVLTPHIPEGLISYMKSFTKSVLKEKPDNIYEFAAVYFERLLLERDKTLYKGYEIFETSEKYIEAREKCLLSQIKSDYYKNVKPKVISTLGQNDNENQNSEILSTQSLQNKLKPRRLSSKKPSEILLSIKEEDEPANASLKILVDSGKDENILVKTDLTGDTVNEISITQPKETIAMDSIKIEHNNIDEEALPPDILMENFQDDDFKSGSEKYEASNFDSKKSNTQEVHSIPENKKKQQISEDSDVDTSSDETIVLTENLDDLAKDDSIQSLQKTLKDENIEESKLEKLTIKEDKQSIDKSTPLENVVQPLKGTFMKSLSDHNNILGESSSNQQFSVEAINNSFNEEIIPNNNSVDTPQNHLDDLIAENESVNSTGSLSVPVSELQDILNTKIECATNSIEEIHMESKDISEKIQKNHEIYLISEVTPKTENNNTVDMEESNPNSQIENQYQDCTIIAIKQDNKNYERNFSDSSLHETTIDKTFKDDSEKVLELTDSEKSDGFNTNKSLNSENQIENVPNIKETNNISSDTNSNGSNILYTPQNDGKNKDTNKNDIPSNIALNTNTFILENTNENFDIIKESSDSTNNSNLQTTKEVFENMIVPEKCTWYVGSVPIIPTSIENDEDKNNIKTENVLVMISKQGFEENTNDNNDIKTESVDSESSTQTFNQSKEIFDEQIDLNIKNTILKGNDMNILNGSNGKGENIDNSINSVHITSLEEKSLEPFNKIVETLEDENEKQNKLDLVNSQKIEIKESHSQNDNMNSEKVGFKKRDESIDENNKDEDNNQILALNEAPKNQISENLNSNNILVFHIANENNIEDINYTTGIAIADNSTACSNCDVNEKQSTSLKDFEDTRIEESNNDLETESNADSIIGFKKTEEESYNENVIYSNKSERNPLESVLQNRETNSYSNESIENQENQSEENNILKYEIAETSKVDVNIHKPDDKENVNIVSSNLKAETEAEQMKSITNSTSEDNLDSTAEQNYLVTINENFKNMTKDLLESAHQNDSINGKIVEKDILINISQNDDSDLKSKNFEEIIQQPNQIIQSEIPIETYTDQKDAIKTKLSLTNKLSAKESNNISAESLEILENIEKMNRVDSTSVGEYNNYNQNIPIDLVVSKEAESAENINKTSNPNKQKNVINLKPTIESLPIEDVYEMTDQNASDNSNEIDQTKAVRSISLQNSKEIDEKYGPELKTNLGDQVQDNFIAKNNVEMNINYAAEKTENSEIQKQKASASISKSKESEVKEWSENISQKDLIRNEDENPSDTFTDNYLKDSTPKIQEHLTNFDKNEIYNDNIKGLNASDEISEDVPKKIGAERIESSNTSSESQFEITGEKVTISEDFKLQNNDFSNSDLNNFSTFNHSKNFEGEEHLNISPNIQSELTQNSEKTLTEIKKNDVSSENLTKFSNFQDSKSLESESKETAAISLNNEDELQQKKSIAVKSKSDLYKDQKPLNVNETEEMLKSEEQPKQKVKEKLDEGYNVENVTTVNNEMEENLHQQVDTIQAKDEVSNIFKQENGNEESFERKMEKQNTNENKENESTLYKQQVTDRNSNTNEQDFKASKTQTNERNESVEEMSQSSENVNMNLNSMKEINEEETHDRAQLDEMKKINENNSHKNEEFSKKIEVSKQHLDNLKTIEIDHESEILLNQKDEQSQENNIVRCKMDKISSKFEGKLETDTSNPKSLKEICTNQQNKLEEIKNVQSPVKDHDLIKNVTTDPANNSTNAINSESISSEQNHKIDKTTSITQNYYKNHNDQNEECNENPIDQKLSSNLDDSHIFSIPPSDIDTTQSKTRSIINDELSEIENMDISTYGEDSLEAMYYSLRKNEIMLDRMQKQASERKSASKEKQPLSNFDNLNFRQVKSMDELQRAASSNSEDEVVIYKMENHNSRIFTENDLLNSENFVNPITFSSAKTERLLDSMHKLSLEQHTKTNQENNEDKYEKKPIQAYSPSIRMNSNIPTPVKEYPKSVSFESPIELAKKQSQLFMEKLHGEYQSSDNLDSILGYDDTSETIRQKMLAYSISEADSDYYELPEGKTNVLHNDSNISTALETASTDTDSTIISAATKIQAGARGFLTRRKLRRESVGAIPFQSDRKASCGNEAIGESLEDLVEENAALKIQHTYRCYLNRRARQSDPLIRNPEKTSSLSRNESDEQKVLGITQVKLEQKSGKKNSKSIANSGEYKTLIDTNFEIAVAKSERSSTDDGYQGLNLAARRLTLQRGDAVQVHSTPDDENGDSVNGNINSDTSSKKKKSTNCEVRRHFEMKQRSLPVQIDSEIFRILPKHMRKRIKSADNGNKKHNSLQ